jgi:predicted nucleotidyltransferase component of viral defense system
MINPDYQRQVALLLRVLPHVMARQEFALKGGTAINLFVRAMPRLSVDIDLVYLPIEDREKSLAGIHTGLNDIKNKIERLVPGTKVAPKSGPGGRTHALVVQTESSQIKIEPNTTIRGTVFPSIQKRIKPIVLKELKLNIPVRAQLVSLPDLFGGKICAALDRQHPRDLFDVMYLLKNEGISPKVRKAFLVYLISHDRPISELLNPNFKDIRELFDGEFQGMTNDPVSLKSLLDTRKKLVKILNDALTTQERQFLISFKKGDPQWPLLGIAVAEILPAPKWKLFNIRKMDSQKREQAREKLRKVLKM